MQELALLVDLVLAVGAGLLGGLLAQRLGQPVILGYLAAGVAIGPFTPGPVGDLHNLSVLAEAGVALLMFALGAEVSLRELRRVGRVAILGGALQVLLSVALGAAAGGLLGLGLVPSIFFGALTALSSTVVAIKLLLARGEMGSLHGRVALGFLIVQDLSLVPMMVILPALAQPPEALVAELARAALAATALLVVTILVGTRVVPWLLVRVAGQGSRELFLLAIVVLALGTALATQFVGLSLAFGAFLAGLIISESELSHQAVAEVLPLRDLFATLFFVTVGMLLDPSFVVRNVMAVIAVAGLVVVGRVVLVSGLVRAFGYSGRVALLVALAVAQMGEFSFVLARLGVEQGLIDAYLYNLTLAGAVVTIIVSPSLLSAGGPLLVALGRAPLVGAAFVRSPRSEPMEETAMMQHHAVICGYGRVGQELAGALRRRGFHYLVIEYDPFVARVARRAGAPVVVGDGSNPEVLRHAGLDRARLIAVTMPDLASADRAVREALRLNPELDVIARAHSAAELERLRLAGAAEVVRPELEAGLEFIRHALRRYGVSASEVQAIIGRRRTEYYAPERANP